MTTLLFGASHAFFMARCLGTFSGDWQDVIDGPLPVTDGDGRRAGHLVLASPRATLFRTQWVDGRPAVHIDERYAAKLREFDTPDTTCYYALGGNEHNAHFLCRHEVPFDFHDERVPTPLLPGRQIIPRQVMQDRLRALLHGVEQQLRVATAALPAVRAVVVAPPPPIPSEAHIRAFPEVFDFSRRAVEDRWVRLKIHTLYLDELAAVCARLGLDLRRPPAEGVDADGFLAEPFWNLSTHAQPGYYRTLLLPDDALTVQ